MDELQLDQNIQKLRLKQGLSLRKLSALAGITPSMLSQSVNTLRSIAQDLNVPMFLLFKGAPVKAPWYIRIIGSKTELDVHYEMLTAGNIEFLDEKSSYRDAMSHRGEEVAYMLSGQWAELELDGVLHRMEPGDSVRIASNTPHVWHNPSDDVAKIIFTITPPTF